MKKLVVLLLVSLMATSAFATIDPDDNMIGIYFDGAAEETSATAAVYDHVFGYVIITNPVSERGSMEFAAVEYNWRLEATPANANAASVTVDLFGATNFGSSPGDMILGLGEPIPITQNLIVTILDLWLFTGDPIALYLGPIATPSLPFGLPVWEDNGALVSLGLSTGGVDIPVATINNGDGPVAIEETSFGSLKSLFR